MAAAVLFGSAVHGQIIEFESGGLKYRALTHNGFTVMFAVLNTRVPDYAILQVAVSNGSPVSSGRLGPKILNLYGRIARLFRLCRPIPW